MATLRVYRDGKLYATFQQPVVWKSLGGNSLWSIRALRINTLNGMIEIDRTFGGRNKFDDKPGARFDYQLPGIEANNDGDMVLVYVRSSTGLPQEVRFSLWDHDEKDIRPSRLLRAEGKNDGPWSDTPESPSIQRTTRRSGSPIFSPLIRVPTELLWVKSWGRRFQPNDRSLHGT